MRIAKILLNKGILLRQLDREDEALASWDEVVLEIWERR